jgi:hypothetical protein
MSPHAPTPKTIADAFAALQDRLDAFQTALYDRDLLLQNLMTALTAALEQIDALTFENRELRYDIDLVTEREREGRERA